MNHVASLGISSNHEQGVEQFGKYANGHLKGGFCLRIIWCSRILEHQQRDGQDVNMRDCLRIIERLVGSGGIMTDVCWVSHLHK